jgi:hypothetical protein
MTRYEPCFRHRLASSYCPWLLHGPPECALNGATYRGCVQMRGKCVVLAVLGHDVNWLTKLQSLQSQSGCLVFAYVSSEERFKVRAVFLSLVSSPVRIRIHESSTTHPLYAYRYPQ